MSDDLLRRATEALRETSSEPNPRSGLTRARVLDSAEKRYGARRGFGLRLVLACMGVFVVGSAFARYEAVLPAIEHVLAAARNVIAPAPAATRTPAKKRASQTPAPIAPAVVEPATPAEAPAIAPVPAQAAAPAVVAPSPTVRAATAPRRAAHARDIAPRVPAVPATPAQAAVPAPAPAPESAELALFRRAQALHVARDPQALQAWDAYLRVAGNGVLAPEARYNRALCLIRAGRNAEARAALLPFANGELGAYRQGEARALLSELPQ
jgi:hypothetical protein